MTYDPVHKGMFPNIVIVAELQLAWHAVKHAFLDELYYRNYCAL